MIAHRQAFVNLGKDQPTNEVINAHRKMNPNCYFCERFGSTLIAVNPSNRDNQAPTSLRILVAIHPTDWHGSCLITSVGGGCSEAITKAVEACRW